MDKRVTGKGRRNSRDYYIFTSINNKRGQLDVRKENYERLNVGDTILLKESSRGGIYIYNLFPTHEEIQKYRNGVLYEPKKSEKE